MKPKNIWLIRGTFANSWLVCFPSILTCGDEALEDKRWPHNEVFSTPLFWNTLPQTSWNPDSGVISDTCRAAQPWINWAPTKCMYPNLMCGKEDDRSHVIAHEHCLPELSRVFRVNKCNYVNKWTMSASGDQEKDENNSASAGLGIHGWSNPRAASRTVHWTSILDQEWCCNVVALRSRKQTHSEGQCR